MTTIKETLMKMSEEEQSTGDGSLIRRINCPVPVIPRPYARGDEMYDCLVKPLMPFQSTPLREGRPTWLPAMNSDMRFQSTPLREGRRPWPYSVSTACDVSIHAPTRGATHYPIQGEGGHEVSIHAPTRGATRLTVNLLNRVFVSIHAPNRLYYTHIQSFLFCISRIKSLLLIKSRTKKYNRYNRLIINHSEPYEIRAMH